jgi:hypothetical protein
MAYGLYCFSEPREYVELNQLLLQQGLKRDISLEYSLRNILEDPLKTSCFLGHGFDIPDMLRKCINCGTIYNQDWKPLTGPHDNHDTPYGVFGDDIHIDFDYSPDGINSEHICKTVSLTGVQCEKCLIEEESIRRGSVRLAIEDPKKWAHHPVYPKAFIGNPERVGYVPLRKRLTPPDKA